MLVILRSDEIDVLKGFIEEAWEHLDGIEDKILELEENQDLDTVNAIFRPVHTIKGTAAFLGFNNIKELCHETETVLDFIRKGRLKVTSDIIDLLLQSVDTVSQMLKAAEEALEETSIEGDEVTLEVKDISFEHLVKELQEVRSPSEDKTDKVSTTSSSVEGRDSGAASEKEFVWKPTQSLDLKEIFFPSGMKEQFLEEAEEHLQNIEDLLLKFEKNEGEIEDLHELFRSLHTLKGNAGVLLSTLENENVIFSHPLTPFKEIAHQAEGLIQLCRDQQKPPSSKEIDFLLKVVDILKELLEDISQDVQPKEIIIGGSNQEISSQTQDTSISSEGISKKQDSGVPDVRVAVLINTLSQALEAIRKGLDEILIKEKRSTALAKVARSFEIIIKVAEDLGEQEAKEEAEKSLNIVDFLSNNEEPEDHESLLLEGIKEGLDIFDKLLNKLKATSKEAPVQKTEPKDHKTEKVTQAQKTALAQTKSKEPKKDSRNKQVIKVPQERLDKLMNLVGELIVSKNNFAILARELSVEYNLPGIAKKVKEFGAGVSRIVDELQATIMSIRMLPVSQVFSRFPRMVRDLSRKLSKKVKLSISGEETELDKTIIEVLGDPLVHLIRNAMDHGLEAPEERTKVGKPEEGTIWLRAYNKGQNVIIEIEDDGRGIDPNKIRAKALERGLISESELERLSDREVINLIFQPGFSTAEQVSEVSGRGVGMDVVRTAIEKIGGSVELESTLGMGTKVTLKLPLTLAISKGLEVEAAGERYYIPLDYVVETVKAPKEAVHWHRGRALVVIRDSLLPMRDLAEALGERSFNTNENDKDEMSLVVLNLGNYKLALKVDRFYNESEFVLKPLIGPLENLSGFSGATVTGEGKILLVLDPPKLLN